MAIQRIERKEYLDKLIAFRDKKIIKVVTGVRRCGKYDNGNLSGLFEGTGSNGGTDYSH